MAAVTNSPTFSPTLRRIKLELEHVQSKLQDNTGIWLQADGHSPYLVHAIIMAPITTAAEESFLYFTIGFPENYPMRPPALTLKLHDDVSRLERFAFSSFINQHGGVYDLAILGCSDRLDNTWLPSISLDKVLIDLKARIEAETTGEFVRQELLEFGILEMCKESNGTKKHLGMPEELSFKVMTRFRLNIDHYEKLFNKCYELSNFDESCGALLQRFWKMKKEEETATNFTKLADSMNNLMKKQIQKKALLVSSTQDESDGEYLD